MTCVILITSAVPPGTRATQASLLCQKSHSYGAGYVMQMSKALSLAFS